MRSEFPGLENRTRQQNENNGPTRAKTGLYLLVGGAVLLIVAGGAFFVGMMKSSGLAPRTAAGTPTTAAATPPATPPAQPAAPQIQWTTIGTFGSWEAKCTTPPGATARLCTAILQVIDNRNKNVLMAWIVGTDEKGVLQSIFQTPTGVMVSSGLDLKLGSAAVHKINFRSCAAQQCVAVTPMNDAFVKEVTAAPKADVTITALNGQQLNFGIPVAGFDKALAAIKK